MNMENQTQPSAQNEPAVVKYHDPKEVLIAARKLIEKPENWTKGVFQNEDRTAFCSEGAIFRVMGLDYMNEPRPPAAALFRAAVGLASDGFIGSFNDSHTHAEVLAAFDRAIELCGTVTVTPPAEKAAST